MEQRMKTCKDCIHYDVCFIVKQDGDGRVLKNSPCKHFKDKELIVEPPCKVGDTVYVDGDSFSEYSCIYYESRFIHSKYFVIGEIVSIVKTKKQLLIKIRVESANHSRYYHKRYTVNAIGKTVFLSKEAAEQAMKEGAGNV